MSWWDVISETTNTGNILFTPGRGLDGGNKKKPFKVISIGNSGIIIQSGSYPINIEKECFVAIEKVFQDNPKAQLRVASLHSNEPFKNSADAIIRTATGSNLARGNYVCSILEYCGLVKYSMQVNKKVIVLPL